MSVVNQMLKDLDKRQQPHALSGVPQHTAVPLSASQPWRLLWLGLIAGVLLVAVGIYGWTIFNDRSHAGTVSPSASQTSALPTPAMAAASATETQTVAAPTVTTETPQAALTPTTATQETAAQPTATAVPITTHVDAASRPSSAVAAPTITPEVAVAAELPKANRQTASDTDGNPQTAVAEARNPSINAAAVKPTETATTGKMQITEVKLTPEQLAQRQYQAGMNAQQNGDMATAVAALQRALELYPALHPARTQLAALYYGAGQLTDAAALLQNGVNHYPSQQQFWLLLGRVQLAQGKSAEAQTSLQHIADASELATDKWLTLAKLGQQNSDWALMQQSYQKLIASAADDGRWWLGLAHAQDAASDYPAALASYRQALQRDNLSLDARAYIENRIAQIGDRQ